MEEFREFNRHTTSPYQTAGELADRLEENGFTGLPASVEWKLRRGGKYYVKGHGSSLAAFQVGKEFQEGSGFRIAAAHTDHPCFCIKPNPDMKEGNYAKLDVEGYGGAILSTWMDRPLGIAGRVAVRSEGKSCPGMRLFDSRRPVLTIPNLPIHMNKEVNKGIELNRQRDMLPVSGMWKEEGLLSWVESELSVERGSILDYDLYVYCCEEGEEIGISGEFYSSPRLDNMTSVFACLQGIMHGECLDGINAAVFFDHEEIGSRTKQGAGSMWLSHLLERIYGGLSAGRMQYLADLEKSMLLSIDVSHAYHPNQGGKYDPNNHVMLNSGVTIKESGVQSYATDSEGIARLIQLMEREGIPYCKYVNRSDQAGGSTLGSIASAFLPVMTVDAGIPVLAMHSAREMMGSEDLPALVKLVQAYFKMR